MPNNVDKSVFLKTVLKKKKKKMREEEEEEEDADIEPKLIPPNGSRLPYKNLNRTLLPKIS